mgnify:CR=1 FL=1
MNILNLKIYVSALIFSATTFTISLVHAETDQQLMLSGQWRDPQTGLIWMRCSVGQKWTGQSCNGEAKEIAGYASQRFESALKNGSGFAGHTNWRLPTTAELSSIRSCSTGWEREVSHQIANIDGTVRNVAGNPKIIGLPPYSDYNAPLICNESSKKPTINNQIFPNTNVNKHRFWWTSQPDGNYEIWIVNFWNGRIATIGGADWKGYIRLVRE